MEYSCTLFSECWVKPQCNMYNKNLETDNRVQLKNSEARRPATKEFPPLPTLRLKGRSAEPQTSPGLH
ncbi:hypothetical protein U0070_010077 [Myodes glareolus]|uniref:Uncharacterized protein n=1 Tax=Myodes glareolus TaxID=447135 RepID=A0AAW0GYD0_MYOGA